jgi:hypothetical protein
MKQIFTTTLSLLSLYTLAQTQINNGGFESWGGNPSPGIAAEPTGWYSNKSGSNIAKAGPTICFQDGTIKRTGSYSVRVETTNYIGTAVNGAVCTGVINAPSFNKSDGYIGTVNFSNTSDIRFMTFTGKPDSLIGWYQYVSGGSGEQPKIRAILHTADYFDPETPTTNHPACIANKIADALWIGGTANQSSWKRFSVPFNYTSTATPSRIMINITSSANQATTIVGSKLWIDDLAVVYNTSTGVSNIDDQKIRIYNYDKTIYVDLTGKTDNNSVITLFDLTGKAIYTQQVESDKLNSFDLSAFSSGLYLYKLSGSGYEKSGKVIFE